MSLSERVIAAVEYYMPHIDVSEYTLDWESDTQVQLMRYIGDWKTYDTIYALFVSNRLTGLLALDSCAYKDFDAASLEDVNYEEHEKAIDSLIEYTKNGHEIAEPELKSKFIALLPDGRFALRYQYCLRSVEHVTAEGYHIQAGGISCHINPCFIIGDSATWE